MDVLGLVLAFLVLIVIVIVIVIIIMTMNKRQTAPWLQMLPKSRLCRARIDGKGSSRPKKLGSTKPVDRSKGVRDRGHVWSDRQRVTDTEGPVSRVPWTWMWALG